MSALEEWVKAAVPMSAGALEVLDPVLDHCQDYSLVSDGVMHEGYWSALLGLRGWPAAGAILSKVFGATGYQLRRSPVGFRSQWHCTPQPQWVFILMRHTFEEFPDAVRLAAELGFGGLGRSLAARRRGR